MAVVKVQTYEHTLIADLSRKMKDPTHAENRKDGAPVTRTSTSEPSKGWHTHPLAQPHRKLNRILRLAHPAEDRSHRTNYATAV